MWTEEWVSKQTANSLAEEKWTLPDAETGMQNCGDFTGEWIPKALRVSLPGAHHSSSVP